MRKFVIVCLLAMSVFAVFAEISEAGCFRGRQPEARVRVPPDEVGRLENELAAKEDG